MRLAEKICYLRNGIIKEKSLRGRHAGIFHIVGSLIVKNATRQYKPLTKIPTRFNSKVLLEYVLYSGEY